MAERSIENPDAGAPNQPEPPVRGEETDDAGTEGERVSRPGEGLVTKEGLSDSL